MRCQSHIGDDRTDDLCYATPRPITAMTWQDAKDACETDQVLLNSGFQGRLCTEEEAYVCCGTGCNYDRVPMWTSTVCNYSPEAPPSPTPPPPEPPHPPPAPPLEDCGDTVRYVCDDVEARKPRATPTTFRCASSRRRRP